MHPELPDGRPFAAAKEASRERRIDALQVNARRVNEALERGLSAGRPAVFVCECGQIGCTVTIALSVAEYEASRADFDRFLIAPHHDLPDIDRVVERHDHYLIVAPRRACPSSPRRQ
jgi:hypothetical protein